MHCPWVGDARSSLERSLRKNTARMLNEEEKTDSLLKLPPCATVTVFSDRQEGALDDCKRG
eukprot:15433075-Alexandrium_andersonii.AAC.1